MVNDGVHCQVENRGGQGVSLGHTAVSLEGVGIVSSGPGYLGNPTPLLLENPELPGEHPLHCKDLKTPFPIQGIIRHMEVHKYLVEDCLIHGHKML